MLVNPTCQIRQRVATVQALIDALLHEQLHAIVIAVNPLTSKKAKGRVAITVQDFQASKTKALSVRVKMGESTRTWDW